MELMPERVQEALLGPRGQCTAMTSDGAARCKNRALPGAYVCKFHGGNGPLSKEAAIERIKVLIEPALDVLYRATRSAPKCDHCGRSDADRDPVALNAAK